MPLLIIFAVVILAVLAPCRTVAVDLQCSECLLLSRLLEHDLETALNKVPDQHVIKGRHNSHIRSELKIYDVIDHACSHLSKYDTEHASALAGKCQLVMTAHREQLEEVVFKDGIEHVRRSLCADLTRACPLHALYDDGGL